MAGRVHYRKAGYRGAYNRPWCTDWELAAGEAYRSPWAHVNGYTDFPTGWSNGTRTWGWPGRWVHEANAPERNRWWDFRMDPLLFKVA